MPKIIGNPVGVPNPKTNWNQADETKADVVLNKPTKLSQFENDTKFVTDNHTHKSTDIVYMLDGFVDSTLQDQLDMINMNIGGLYTGKADNTATVTEADYTFGEDTKKTDTIANLLDEIFLRVSKQERAIGQDLYPMINSLEFAKADKPLMRNSSVSEYTFDFSNMYNSEMRLTSPSAISIKFVDTEYEYDYISGLSFNCGETPTQFDYSASGIINWVGTDCTTSNGLSIFQPSANTHYDIVFYFNGVQFIGLVNGFVPATGNEAV